MALTTSLAGRVRNTSLPKSHPLLPLQEAVVNSLQAIDQRFGEGDIGRGNLRIQILRDGQQEFDYGSTGPGRVALPPIIGFSIEDNGVGFTPANMSSFETLDSDFKAALGSRGVGRLLWLKAFERVSVDSGFYGADEQLKARSFKFSVEREVEQVEASSPPLDSGAVLHLDGFRSQYQKSAPKTADAIAREIFEHCIWYFLRPGGAPNVTVVDDETISLNKLMEEYVNSSLPATSITVKGQRFEMVNLCLKSTSRNTTPRLYWCAASRVVIEESLAGKLAGLYGRLRDSNSEEFTYICYLSSDFLDTQVRSDRTAFDIPERIAGAPLDDDLTLDDVREAVLKKVATMLEGPLAAAREEGRTRVNDFVSDRAPRYRPVLARISNLGLTVDPSMKDSELEVLLHRSLQRLEVEALVEGHAVLAEAGAAPLEDYKERLDKYLEAVKDINQSDLAAYVARRRAILDILAKLIRSNETGKYSREDAVHSLLIPMRTDSNQLGADVSNLWILDERLAFHDYLASDKPLKSMPITGAESAKRPDIIATRLVNGPLLASEGETLPLPSIVVVEIKRPMRNDADEDTDPIAQCLEYVEKVRSGGVLTAQGRPIPASNEVPAFCYVVADLTPKMVSRCKIANLRRTHDGLGYFGFNEPTKTYIEVMSFDQLVKSATERNRAFFDKLGLPAS